MDPIFLKRIADIKLLFSDAFEQSRKDSRLASYTVLSFYDIVEWVLILAIEQKGVRDKPKELMHYWKPEYGLGLTHESEMDKLRLIRRNLKHQGLFPNSDDIIIVRNSTQEFVEKTVMSQFGFDFQEISLASIIDNPVIAEHLSEAEKATLAGDYASATGSCSFAFSHLISQYLDATTDSFSERRKFPFTDARRWSLPTALKGSDYINEELIKLRSEIDETKNYLRVQASGIDMEKYRKFLVIAPEVYITSGRGGKGRILSGRTRSVSKDESQFCIDFVVESFFRFSRITFE
jgi:hypothetical protein